MSDNATKYEVFIEQYLRSILDVSRGRLYTYYMGRKVMKFFLFWEKVMS